MNLKIFLHFFVYKTCLLKNCSFMGFQFVEVISLISKLRKTKVNVRLRPHYGPTNGPDHKINGK